jgi:hypothetical protein
MTKLFCRKFLGVFLGMLLSFESVSKVQAQLAWNVDSQVFTPKIGAIRAKLEMTLAFSNNIPNDTSSIDFPAFVGNVNPLDQVFLLEPDGFYYLDFILNLRNINNAPNLLDVDQVTISLLPSSSLMTSDLGFIPVGNFESTSYFSDPPIPGPGAYPTSLKWDTGLLPVLPLAAFPASNGKFSTHVRLDTVDNFPVTLSLADFNMNVRATFHTVPEPSTFVLAGVSAVGLVLLRRRYQ